MAFAFEKYNLFKIWINKYSHQFFPNFFVEIVEKPSSFTTFGIQTFHPIVVLSFLVVMVLVLIIAAAKKKHDRQLKNLANLHKEVCDLLTETTMRANMLRPPIQEGDVHYPLWQVAERILHISRIMDAMRVMLEELERDRIYNLFHS